VCALSPLLRTLDQAILTIAIARRIFNTHARRGEFTIETNQVRKITIRKGNQVAEMRAYSGTLRVRYPTPYRSRKPRRTSWLLLGVCARQTETLGKLHSGWIAGRTTGEKYTEARVRSPRISTTVTPWHSQGPSWLQCSGF
jgi:hypothetical protein